jgi:nucleotide-binding universal stress UspA family protein
MEEQPMRRIVVGIDGSHSSIAALHWAAIQATSTGSILELIMTWEWPMDLGWCPTLPADYNPEASAHEILDEAEERVREMHGDVQVRSTLIHGQASSALIEASRGAALLVVGNRGHGEFVGMLLGSVSEHCVAHAHCPVLVFRFQEERTRQHCPHLPGKSSRCVPRLAKVPSIIAGSSGSVMSARLGKNHEVNRII